MLGPFFHFFGGKAFSIPILKLRTPPVIPEETEVCGPNDTAFTKSSHAAGMTAMAPSSEVLDKQGEGVSS